MSKTTTVTRVNRADWDGDGIADSIYETKTVSDRKGNVLSIQDRSDYQNDGTWDWTTLTTNEYNHRGRLTESEYKADWDGNGQWDQVSVTENTWDGKLLLSEVVSSDYDNDGNPEYIYGTFNEYNNKDQLIERLQVYDWDGDGNNDYEDLYSYVYDGKQLVQETGDYGNDGTIDYVTDILYA